MLFRSTSNGDVVSTLPFASTNAGLIIELKKSSSNNYVVVQPQDCDNIDNQNHILLSSDKPYTRLISTGLSWVELLNHTQSPAQAQSASVMAVGPSGSPGGDPYSLQYNAITGFDGGSAYIDPINHKLLLGSSSEITASTILPLSNNKDTVFNNLRGSGNFKIGRAHV